MNDKEYEEFVTKLYDRLRNWKEEYVLTACNWYNDGQKHIHEPDNIESGYVICGRRHHNIFSTVAIIVNDDMEKIKSMNITCEQGFLTSKNRWLNRADAFELAVKVGQIARPEPIDTEAYFDKVATPPLDHKIRPLFSEDLY